MIMMISEIFSFIKNLNLIFFKIGIDFFIRLPFISNAVTTSFRRSD